MTMLTAAQTSRRLDVDRSTLLAWVRAGYVQPDEQRPDGSPLFDEKRVDEIRARMPTIRAEQRRRQGRRVVEGGAG